MRDAHTMKFGLACPGKTGFHSAVELREKWRKASIKRVENGFGKRVGRKKRRSTAPAQFKSKRPFCLMDASESLREKKKMEANNASAKVLGDSEIK